MNVHNWPIQIEKENDKPNLIMVLGAFETIHLGHYELFKLAKQLKKEKTDYKICCLLFKNKNNNNPKAFQLKTRIYTLANLGVDNVIIINFNEDFKNMDAVTFIEHLKKINVKEIVVGNDYKFGFNRQGNNELLKKHFVTHVIKEKKINNTKISSTVIKQLISEGNLEVVNNLLVDDYAFITSFEDYHFDFPENLIKLPSGIYFTNLVYRDIEYHGFIHINYDNERNRVIFLDLTEDILFFDEVFVEILKLHRKIDHIAENKIFKLDTKEAINFFKNKV